MLNRLPLSRLLSRRRSGGAVEGQSSPDRARRGGSPQTGARVVCIASGKGGTGKSVVASNLAIQRARMGERVLLVDFDAGMANAHLLLGMTPVHDLGHVLDGDVSARNALVQGPHGLSLLSGGVGRQTLINPTRRQLDRLFKALAPLEEDFDLIVIDHGAGLGYSTLAHLAATSTLIMVTNPELTALSDAYALYKRAVTVNPSISVGVVINRAEDEGLAKAAWGRFRGASIRFLSREPEYIGWVPADRAITQSVQQRSPVTVSWPDSPAAKALQAVVTWSGLDLARGSQPFFQRARKALR
jgi:flagellar biosynthesis protein FlhG